jgi:3-oxoacyl-[acyl-carrier-protein] synthase-3
MNLKYFNKKIEGIITIIPSNEVFFDDEIENYNFSTSKSLKLKMAMGFEKHCIVEDNICISDLLIKGFVHLFDNNLLKKEDIDALILVTQTPDYILPPTSNIIQGKLGLKHSMICLDINQGCAGYIIGLTQAFMLLDQENINTVALLNADVLSKRVSKNDRNSYPLTGDAASITIVKKSEVKSTITGFIKMDGSGADSLIIPAGGFKLKSSADTAVLIEDNSGNFRSLDHLTMKGDDIFNFVNREVPPMIDEVLTYAGKSKEDIDFYMFHQPNKFLLTKLADKLKIPYNKMPSNIVANFGNSSGVTIPTNITFNLGDKLLNNSFNLCLAGFGVGLTWAALILDMGYLKFNKIIRF